MFRTIEKTRYSVLCKEERYLYIFSGSLVGARKKLRNIIEWNRFKEYARAQVQRVQSAPKA